MWNRRSPVQVALLAGLAYLPFVGLGYGTDIDITNTRRSGESILDGDYRISRAPGAIAHEFTTGVLDRIGGSVAVALGSALAAVATLVLLARIVDRSHGARAGRIAVVVVATQPWFWVAATSLGDYVYALALLLLGVDLAQRDRRVAAGLAFAVAIGFRSTAVLLVGAYLIAELTGRSSGDGASRRATLTSGAVAAGVGVLFSIPPWLSVGRTADFLQNQFEAGGVAVMVARWGIKNVAFFGVATIVVVVVRSPAVGAALGRFRDDVLVRFAVFGAVATELLFLRFPWKPLHLLPLAVMLALFLATSPAVSGRLVAVVVGSQLLLAVVGVSLAEPDVPGAATSGRFAPGLTPGVVANEIRCRLDTGDWPNLDTIEADYEAYDVFECQARSWRAGEPSTEPRLPSDPPF